MNICIEEKSELYYKVKNKVDVLDKPISANIKGRVNSTHLCNSNGCDPVMFITLDNIIYNEK
ncbi:MAG: hypothetical protein U9Q16_01210 [Patescibacteria group bacterium]|nr:hypothetical protein [Patescibacteria group bacterium]